MRTALPGTRTAKSMRAHGKSTFCRPLKCWFFFSICVMKVNILRTNSDTAHCQMKNYFSRQLTPKGQWRYEFTIFSEADIKQTVGLLAQSAERGVDNAKVVWVRPSHGPRQSCIYCFVCLCFSYCYYCCFSTWFRNILKLMSFSFSFRKRVKENRKSSTWIMNTAGLPCLN